jgi:hypothetical protein
MSNLLVVDWDSFFFNPIEAADTSVDQRWFWKFDWGHSEHQGAIFLDAVWPMRAGSFIKDGYQLPHVDVPEGFWDRFTFTDDAVGEVSDSNMYSGVVADGREFEHVWLFDAHHDMYGIKTKEQLVEFANKNEVTCENWMFVHYLKGAKLHWRYPRWNKAAGQFYRPQAKKWGCDARKDDGAKLDPVNMVFDAVSVCRSGCWVPPWCDPDFKEFCDACPVPLQLVEEDVPLMRDWDSAVGASKAMTLDLMEQQARAQGMPPLPNNVVGPLAMKLADEYEAGHR